MTNYTYDADSNLTQQNNPNGTVEKLNYDSAEQVTEVMHEKSDATVLGYFSYGYNYGYNSDGLVDNVEGDGSIITYNYDAVFRLISEQRQFSYPYSVSYSYDAAGNRLTNVWGGQQTSYSYDAADQLLNYDNRLVQVTYLLMELTMDLISVERSENPYSLK